MEIEPAKVEPHDPALLGTVARRGAWNVLGYVISASSALVINVIIARKLGPAGFGTFSIFIWIARTTFWLGVFGIPSAITRVVSEYQGAGDPEGSKAMFRLAIIYQSMLMPVLFLASAGWVLLKSQDLLTSVGVGAIAILLAYIWAFEQGLGGLRRYRSVARNAGIVAIVQLSVIGIMAMTAGSVRNFILLNLLIQAATVTVWGLSVGNAFKAWRRRPTSPKERKRFRRLAGTMALVAVSDNVLWGRPEIFFLERAWSEKEVGLYSAALVLQTLTVNLPWIASRVLTPEFAWLRGGGKDEILRRIFPQVCRYIAFVAMPLCIGGAVIAGDLLQVAYGDRFSNALGASVVLMAGGALISIAGPASSAAFTGPNPGFMARLAAIMAGVNVGLDVLLIPPFGSIGAAVATVAAQSTTVVIAVVHVRRRMGLVYPMRSIFLLASAALISALLARRLAVGIDPSTLRIAVTVILAGALYMGLAKALRIISWKELRDLVGRTKSSSISPNGP